MKCSLENNWDTTTMDFLFRVWDEHPGLIIVVFIFIFDTTQTLHHIKVLYCYIHIPCQSLVCPKQDLVYIII